MHMREFLRVGIGFALLGSVSLAAAQTTPAPKPPRIAVTEDTVDLGEVTRGEKIVATYELRNFGDSPLKILKVNPG